MGKRHNVLPSSPFIPCTVFQALVNDRWSNRSGPEDNTLLLEIIKTIQGCQIANQHKRLCAAQLKHYTTIYLWALKLSWVSLVLCKEPLIT